MKPEINELYNRMGKLMTKSKANYFLTLNFAIHFGMQKSCKIST